MNRNFHIDHDLVAVANNQKATIRATDSINLSRDDSPYIEQLRDSSLATITSTKSHLTRKTRQFPKPQCTANQRLK
jgi:hypothetical protein